MFLWFYPNSQPSLLLFFLILLPLHSWADIRTDGTVGVAQTLAGTDYLIPQQLGQRVGNNLLHSFSSFNLNADEIATFTGTAEIDNLIARVTGDSMSVLNGTLRSTLSNADFYFINPRGIQFGSQAQLDVPAAFYASTAAQLALADGGHIDAVNPTQSILTAAAPSAFGFFNSSAQLSIQGSHLQVNAEQVLHLSSEILSLNAAQLQARQLQLHGQTVEVDNSNLNAAQLDVTAATLLLDNGSVLSSHVADGQMTFAATEQITVAGREVDTGVATTMLSSAGANIYLNTPRLTVRDSGTLQTATLDNRNAGNIVIHTQQLELDNLARISSLTLGSGNGGNLDINSDSVILQRNAALNAGSSGAGNAGHIVLRADHLLLQDTSLLSTTAIQARGGDITLQLGELQISAQSGISATAGGSRSGGTIQIQARQVDLTAGSSITAASTATGNAGQIRIDSDMLRLTAQSSIDSQALQAAGGNIMLNATRQLQVQDSQITAQAQGDQRQDAGGNLHINAADFVVLDDALLLASAVFGDGGRIEIVTGDLIATPSSVLDASSQFGLTGEVFIDAPDSNLDAQLLPLSVNYWDASGFIRQRCAVRLGQDLSSLFITEYEILPLVPEWLEDYWLE